MWRFRLIRNPALLHGALGTSHQPRERVIEACLHERHTSAWAFGFAQHMDDIDALLTIAGSFEEEVARDGDQADIRRGGADGEHENSIGACKPTFAGARIKTEDQDSEVGQRQQREEDQAGAAEQGWGNHQQQTTTPIQT